MHEYFEDGGLELYNLREDIGEQHNLAEKMPEKTKQLHAMLESWRGSIDAPVPSEPNPNYDAKAERAAVEKALSGVKRKRGRRKLRK